MKPDMTDIGRASGFTLIEILISLIMFATVMTALYTSFNSFVLSSHRLNQILEVDDSVQGGLGIVRTDLMSSFVVRPPRYQKPESTKISDPYRFVLEEETVDGESFSRLRFASLNHLPLDGTDQMGPAQIIYYVRSASDTGFDLCRSDSLQPYGDGDVSDCDPVLFKSVKRVSITCTGIDGESASRWNSESSAIGYATPASVRLTITVASEGLETVVDADIELPASRGALESQ